MGQFQENSLQLKRQVQTGALQSILLPCEAHSHIQSTHGPELYDFLRAKKISKICLSEAITNDFLHGLLSSSALCLVKALIRLLFRVVQRAPLQSAEEERKSMPAWQVTDNRITSRLVQKTARKSWVQTSNDKGRNARTEIDFSAQLSLSFFNFKIQSHATKAGPLFSWGSLSR